MPPLLQLMLPTFQEAGTDGRAGAQQIQQQPALALEITHEAKIFFRTEIREITRVFFLFLPAAEEFIREGEVVMNAGNSLHLAAVTHPKAVAIQRFHTAHISS